MLYIGFKLSTKIFFNGVRVSDIYCKQFLEIAKQFKLPKLSFIHLNISKTKPLLK
jgi:hypothetical protein